MNSARRHEPDATAAVWAVLANVPDPEIPALSVVDLGIVRYVRWPETAQPRGAAAADERASTARRAQPPSADQTAARQPGATSAAAPGPRVGITPTYSGCPATAVIRNTVQGALQRAGYAHAVIEEVLTPPWSSDWISAAGRQKLQAFGIAPPAEAVSSPKRLFAPLVIQCPRCGSRDTERLSEFGSTPCKAHYRCKACLEPFDYFKCI